MTSLAAPPSQTARIAAFDGLRGVAAVIVVVFHYLCMLHPSWAPISDDVELLAHTPVHILWNGRLAVSVFFVLSGFVMAAAAERRRDLLVVTAAARYLRLAVPATASCVLAWLWLVSFPSSATQLQGALDEPSRWLDYTYQQPIPPVWHALADGAVANFLRGYSRFNNVLWTMQIELFGSLAIFLLYAVTRGAARLATLAASGAAVLLWFSDAYLGFIFGAALYEGHRRGLFQSVPAVVAVIALAMAVALGGPGEGAHLRLNLPDVPDQWQMGTARGVMNAVAAALLTFGVLALPAFTRALSRPLPVFLGRISFGLYLVHVPPLYSIVAWSYLQDVPEYVLAPVYGIGMLILAWIFTLLVDEPSLRWLSGWRKRAGRIRIAPPGRTQSYGPPAPRRS
nr:acyltransferase [Paracoccus saliphilus]